MGVFGKKYENYRRYHFIETDGGILITIMTIMRRVERRQGRPLGEASEAPPWASRYALVAC